MNRAGIVVLMTTTRSRAHWTLPKVGLYALHLAIILNFITGMFYAAYMVFFVVTPAESGPLWGRATSIPFEMMTTRRLYAAEFWLTTIGLSAYLGLTEIAPRLAAHRAAKGSPPT